MKKSLLTIGFALVVLSNMAVAQWQQISNTNAQYVQCFAVKGDTMFAGTGYQENFTSTDGGTTWTLAFTGLTNNVNALTMYGTKALAGMNGSGIFATTNNGASWDSSWTGLHIPLKVMALCVKGTTIYLGSSNYGLYTSTNGGLNWTSNNTGIPNYLQVYAFAVAGNNLFAATNNGIYLSKDDAASWTLVNSTAIMTNMAVKGTSVLAGGVSGVIMSADTGKTWTTIKTGLPSTPNVAALQVSGNAIFAGTLNNGVYLSVNNGASWTAVNTGLPASTSSLAFAVHGTKIFTGTAYYTYSRTISEMITGIDEADQNMHAAIYPNPANESVTIELPEYRNAIAELLNAEGQLIRSVQLNGMMTQIQTSDLANGFYFVKISGPEGFTVKKLLKN